MKNFLFLALILTGCASNDDLQTVRKDVLDKVPVFISNLTGGGAFVKECSLYQLDPVTDKAALDFRIWALSDSLIIQKRLAEHYTNLIEMRKKDMKGLVEIKMSTDTVQQIIDRYKFRIDSINMAGIKTKKELDSLTAANTGTGEKNHYVAMFRICLFNITTTSTCDSFAFLFDKKRNLLSMHLKNKL